MHPYPKVTVGVILYKGEKYLPYSLRSLVNQDYPNIEFLFRDQSPHGEAYDFIEKQLPDVFDRVQMEKGENRWHSGGHNILMNQMTGDYYFCCSNDMWYPPHFVSRMTHEFSKHEYKKYGSATCKLMVWDFEKISHESLDGSKTEILDSCGLGLQKNHHFFDLGQGEPDKGQYDHKKNIFGASGALTVLRKEALKDIAYVNEKGGTEYWDELLHYKNDVDLAYRLQWAGWPCLFIPEVKVYHDRQAANLSRSKSLIVRILKARKGKARWVKENSFFGQEAVLMKNYTRQFSPGVRFRTWIHRWATIFFALLFEPYLLKQFRTLRQNKKEILARRDAIHRAVKPEAIERFMK